MTSERTKAMDDLIAQDADLIDIEPVAYRYGFDGYGWQYIDNGSGSDWAIRHPDGEPLYAHPPADRIEALEAENERLVASNEQWQVDYNEVVLEKLELLAVLREMTPDYEMLVDQSWDDGAIWSWVEKAKGIAAKARAALGEKK